MSRRSTLLTAVGAVAGAAIAAWLFRRLAQPAAPSAAPATPSEGLTAIKGIGPVYSTRLEAAGITDFDTLIATGPEAVAAAAEVLEAAAEDWIAQARALL